MPFQLIEARSDTELAAKIKTAITANLLPYGNVLFSDGLFYIGVATGTASGAADCRVITAPDSVRLKAQVDAALTATFTTLGGTVRRGAQYVQVMVKGVPAAGGGGTVTSANITDATAVGRAVLTAADTTAAVAAIGLAGVSSAANFLIYKSSTDVNSNLSVVAPNSGSSLTLQATNGASSSIAASTGLVLSSTSGSVTVTSATTTASGLVVATGTAGVGVRAAANNVVSCGSAAVGWTAVYAQSATITPSDERLKNVVAIPDALLDAWSTVDFVGFTFKEGGVRKHLGVIAQRVKEAFEAAGFDPFEWALLCHDEWEEVPEVPAVPATEAITDAEGNVLIPAVAEVPAIPAIPAGDRYAMRYEEALVLEAALMRRTVQRLSAKA